MARNGSGVYSLPAGYEAVTGETILATQHNTPLEDLASDANAARPLVTGGTGATTAIGAIDNIVTRAIDIATASTIDLDSATGVFVDLTGTTTVTAVTLANGAFRMARAVGAFQLTASASLVVNGSTSVNYTTTAGELLAFEGYSGAVRVWAIASPLNAGLVDIAALAKTDGNFIVGNGTTWVAESGSTVHASLGLAVVWLQTVNASGASNIDLETGFGATYDHYIVTFNDIVPGTGGATLYLRFKFGGSYGAGASDYQYAFEQVAFSGTSTLVTDSAESYIMLAGNVGNSTNEFASGDINLYGANSSRHKFVKYGVIAKTNGAVGVGNDGKGIIQSGNLITGARLTFSSGTISGNASLYGVRKA